MRLVIFPHQLYAQHPGLDQNPSEVVLIEDSLFFGDGRYPMRFHKQKLWLHRATMKRYERRLQEQGHKTRYLEYAPSAATLGDQLAALDWTGGKEQNAKSEPSMAVMDPVDFVLNQRIRRFATKHGVTIHWLPCSGFLNTSAENAEYRSTKKRWFMADFYKWQRRRHDILIDDGQPRGGQWSFDESNRKKVPKNRIGSIPEPLSLPRDEFDLEAQRYVERRFPDHPGRLDQLFYPTSHVDAKQCLDDFLTSRMESFGDYEDAIVEGQSWLWHSVLTPSLNIGLLTPSEVLDATLQHADANRWPLNSLEGFVRQILGWREFMRATYEDLGVAMRTTNHWRHHRPMPKCFYDASTGIAPIDDTIRRLLETGYCHHIERLMVLGGFLFLCEIDPDAIYQWFMEMFVDSYDWVMVPNVYAMSQHADGGQITTKPYFSGSSYIRKMSHYGQDDWCQTWDGLYWRWIGNHAEELAKNPRWAMMCSMARKMDKSKRQSHLDHARRFLDQLA